MRLRVAEFYSGMGGMHASCLRVNEIFARKEGEDPIQLDVIDAFDINIVANDCYLHNFKKRPRQVSIESLKLSALDGAYDVWTMSPPCQPFTRGGKKRGTEDNRCASFLYLMDILPKLTEPPSYVLLENVHGFETSPARDQLVEVLRSCGFAIQEFLISPVQMGIPNERLRYYCLAKRGAARSFVEPGLGSSLNTNFPANTTLHAPHTLGVYLKSDLPEDRVEQLLMPGDVIEKAVGFLFEVVNPRSEVCSCFAKAYGSHFWRASGALVETQSDDQVAASSSATAPKDRFRLVDASERLRYFEPREILALHGFDTATYDFPPTFSDLQKYRLLGNGISVFVVSELLHYLLLEP